MNINLNVWNKIIKQKINIRYAERGIIEWIEMKTRIANISERAGEVGKL